MRPSPPRKDRDTDFFQKGGNSREKPHLPRFVLHSPLLPGLAPVRISNKTSRPEKNFAEGQLFFSEKVLHRAGSILIEEEFLFTGGIPATPRIFQRIGWVTSQFPFSSVDFFFPARGFFSFGAPLSSPATAPPPRRAFRPRPLLCTFRRAIRLFFRRDS